MKSSKSSECVPFSTKQGGWSSFVAFCLRMVVQLMELSNTMSDNEDSATEPQVEENNTGDEPEDDDDVRILEEQLLSIISVCVIFRISPVLLSLPGLGSHTHKKEEEARQEAWCVFIVVLRCYSFFSRSFLISQRLSSLTTSRLPTPLRATRLTSTLQSWVHGRSLIVTTFIQRYVSRIRKFVGIYCLLSEAGKTNFFLPFGVACLLSSAFRNCVRRFFRACWLTGSFLKM